MGADPCMPTAPITIADAGKGSQELEATVLQLQTELSRRERAEEESSRINKALQLQLAEKAAELASANNLLRQEMQWRSEDREEISLLNAKLVRQKHALEVLNEELETFGYSVSHDLRAPLRHMMGFTGMLAEDYRDSLDAVAQGYLDCVMRAGRKMESLFEALLKLSRVTRQEFSIASVDLSVMARECAQSLKESAPERSVVFTIADNLSARADAALLKAAIGNLLGNAWKYTGKKDVATIEFGRKQEGETTVFYLSDNGAGFDMQYADRLFGPFQRMHRESEFEGTGVGLATVQRIIRRHGGRIWADAAVGCGATFYFTLSGCYSA